MTTVQDDPPTTMVDAAPAPTSPPGPGTTAPPNPPSTVPERSEPYSARAWVAAALSGLGIVALAFVGFQLWASDVVQARSQRELRSQLDSWVVQAQGFAMSAGGAGFGTQFGGAPLELLDEGAGVTVPELDKELTSDAVSRLDTAGFDVAVTTEPSSTVLPGVVLRTEPPGGAEVEPGARVTVVTARLGQGAPVGLIRLPALGVEQVVVEGTGPAMTMRGPGHLRGTPLPGELGTSVVLGHRTTYGGPFAKLGRLRDGDEIQVVTPGGAFVYRVDGDPRIVRAGEPDVVEVDGERARLVLATAHPELSARDRLVVEAELDGDPVAPPPAAGAATTVVELRPDELGRTGSPGGWTAVALWGQFLLAALVVTHQLYRRWLRWPTWLLTTPVLVALAFAFFGAVSLLLPSTL